MSIGHQLASVENEIDRSGRRRERRAVMVEAMVKYWLVQGQHHRLRPEELQSLAERFVDGDAIKVEEEGRGTRSATPRMVPRG